MKHVLRFFMILFYFLISCGGRNGVFAQKTGQALIDSLIPALQNASEDSNKVNMLATISYVYYNINPEEGIKYGEEALDLATTLGWKKGMAKVYNNIAVNYYRESNNISALEYYQKALKLDEEMHDKHAIAIVVTNMGLIYQSQYDVRTALEYDIKNLKLLEELGDKNTTAIMCGNIGNIYRSQNDYATALQYDFKALKIKEEIGNKGSIAITLGNIGIVYRCQKNYALSIQYCENALKLAEETGDKYIAANNLCSIGECYIAIVKDSSAPNALKEIPHTQVNTQYGDSAQQVYIPASKAVCLRMAIDYLQKAITICEGIHAPDVIQECYEGLSEVYKLNHDYSKALEYADNARVIKDSVYSKDKSDKILKMELNIEYEKKRNEAQKVASLKLQRQQIFTYSGIAGILLLAGFSFFIVKERRKSDHERKIAENERKKSDDLLLNILPSEVADELKTKGTTKAKYFDHVTVLFTDFVNFTKAGERMSPQGLIDELDTCFKAFDEITVKHNIEKIKTIGDAYLAVCGLPAPNPDHAQNIVSAALEITAFMHERYAKLGDKTFEIRIGIHTGSVVAGIVGVKKFAYDIWGDTVNIAARMEQNSMPGKINISETTYELVKDKFTCEYRGEIEAKNKGAMKMYFVSVM